MCDHNHHDSGCCHGPPGDDYSSYSLYKFIDTNKLECLNEAVRDSGRLVFKPHERRMETNPFVESDGDHELLFNIPFTGSVKLKGIIIAGPDNDEHPRSIILYKNRSFMAFSDVDMHDAFSFYSTSLATFSAMLQPFIPFVESSNNVCSVTGENPRVVNREMLVDEVTRLFNKQEYYRSAYNEVVQRLTVLSSIIPEYAFDNQFIEPNIPGVDEACEVELDDELIDFMMVTLRHREERNLSKLKEGVMGVHGLTSYLQHDERNFEGLHLHHTDVIIDAYNFLHYIYLNSSLYTQFGGENHGFCENITRIIRSFQRCDIKPIFVFDGCHEESKLNTQISRSFVRLSTCRNLVRQVSTNKSDVAQSPVFRIPIVPPSAPLLLAQTLKLLKIDFVVADRECDLAAVCLAVCLQCPVISNDSDFYISVPTPGTGVSYLPLSFLSFNPVLMESRCADCENDTSEVSERHCAYLSCCKFILNGPSFHKLPPEQRPLLASLVGNDHIPPQVFLPYLPVNQALRTHLSMASSKVMRQSRRKTLFETLINWLSGFGSNQAEPVKRILSRCPKAQVENLKKMLIYSMATYYVDPVSVRQTLLKFVTPTSESDSSGQTDSENSEYYSVEAASSLQNDSSSSCSELQEDENGIITAEAGPCLTSSRSKLNPDKPVISVEFTQNWSERLVYAFRKCLLFPGFLDAVYARGLVLNCGVESLDDCKSIHQCASLIRKLLYNVLLGVEQSVNGRAPSDFPGVFCSSNRFTVLEFLRKGSSRIRKCVVEVTAMPVSASRYHDRRIVFIQDKLVSEYHPNGFVEDLALLASLWFVNETTIASSDIPSSPVILALGAIAATSYTFQEHFPMRQQKIQRRYKQHLTNCTSHFISLLNKKFVSRREHSTLKLTVVHAFGQLHAIYMALTSLGAILDSLADDDERKHLDRCIPLQPLTVVLPSGCLFHFVVQFLTAVVPSGRLSAVMEIILPKLVFTTNEENRETMVQKVVVFLMAYITRLFSYVKSMKLIPMKGDESAELVNTNVSDSKIEVKVGTEKKKISRKHKKRHLVVKRSADIEAEVDRLMRQNGLD